MTTEDRTFYNKRRVVYGFTSKSGDLVIQRILVRHRVSLDLGDLLLGDMRRCIEYFKENPVTTPMTERTAGGYRH